MATANTKTLVYNDFSKGEFGALAPEKAPDGSWTGRNMVVYRDGCIGPRPGLREFAPTGLPTGEISGLGFVPTVESDQSAIWFISGTTVYGFRPGAAAATAVTPNLAAAVPAGEFVWFKESTRQLFGKAYFTVGDDKGYRLTLQSDTLEAVAQLPGGRDIETYKERMLVVDNSPQSTRIFFSAPADYDVWPAENFFDVGASWPVGQIVEFRDGLAIFTNSGLWLLTGTLPDTAVLRRVSDALPPHSRAIVSSVDGMVYIPNARSAPVVYTGSSGDEEQLNHLETWKDVNDAVSGIMVYGNRDLLFLSETAKMLWRKNGVWAQHTFGVGVGPYLVRYFDEAAVLTDGGAPGVAPKFYGLTMSIDRPAFTTDTFSQPGDDSNTPLDAFFSLPDYYAEDGSEIRVRQVIVDFTKYNTGAPVDNNITLQVEGLARFRLPGTGGSVATQSWTEPGSGANTSGIRDRWVFNVGQSSYHGGFRVSLQDVRGVKISRIVVDIETLGRPRS